MRTGDGGLETGPVAEEFEDTAAEASSTLTKEPRADVRPSVPPASPDRVERGDSGRCSRTLSL